MSKRRENRSKKKKLRLLLALAAITMVGVFIFSPFFLGDGKSAEGPAPKPEAPITLNISCVGDIMIHSPQIPAQYDPKTGDYDFTNNFQYIKKYISKSDIALCNLETTFGGEPYSGYPNFSSPDSLAKALKETGFDVAMTANNHMMDKGVIGLKRTVDVLNGYGLNPVGSRITQEDKRYTIVEAKGIKVGVVAYTYETPSIDSRVAINGTYISPEASNLISSFNYDRIDESLAEIDSVVNEARTAGAEIVVLYLHWGQEYQTKANNHQRSIASNVAKNMDVDVIFGSHSHVLQEMEMVTNPDTGKQIPVFFSMGNFISNQRVETLPDLANSKYTEQGIIAKVNIEYMKSTKKIQSVVMDKVPTWVDKYSQNGKNVYAVVPLDEGLASNEALAASGHISRAKNALEDINGILESN